MTRAWLRSRPRAAQPAPAARRGTARSRRARVLPLLAVLFALGAGLRLVSGVGAALAQDPLAGSDAALQPVALRSSPVSDAQLSLEIRERERAVAAREAELEERAALVGAAQARVQAQIEALQAAEAELAATMALADRAAEDDITRLVAVFQAMRAEDAAAVFTEMDPQFAAGFLARMEPAPAAAILAGLDPRQAYGLSAIFAGRNALVPQE